VSISGLPYGVPGQMLSGKLNKNINWYFRGLLVRTLAIAPPFLPPGSLVSTHPAQNTPPESAPSLDASMSLSAQFGMTERGGWRNDDLGTLKALWRIWDAFGITRAEMTGFWSSDAVVRVEGNTAVRATAFTREGRGAIIVVASWAEEEEPNLELHIDWQRLGVPAEQSLIDVPIIPKVQDADKTSTLKKSQNGNTLQLSLGSGGGILFYIGRQEWHMLVNN
jgi:hypothetical protein